MSLLLVNERLRRALLPILCAYFRFAAYLTKRPPAAECVRGWRHLVPRGHISGSRSARVGANLRLSAHRQARALPRPSSRSRFVHGFTSAYSDATTNPASTGVHRPCVRPGPRPGRAKSSQTPGRSWWPHTPSLSRRHMSQQRTGHSNGPAFPDLPEATVARLPEYLRALHHLAEA